MFSRKPEAARRRDAKGPRHAARRGEPAARVADEVPASDEAFARDEPRRPGAAGRARGAKERTAPEFGPYDLADASEEMEGLDLGALRLPAVEGVEVRVQADQEGRIQQIVLVSGDSAVQLGVLAAPRSEGIWDEVREELREQLRADGFAAREIDGDYGVELLAKVDSPEGPIDVRFVGVDGPRWMVRALMQGPVALDPEAAPALLECVRGLVVDRGGEAFPVREPLPLRLPREIAEQHQHSAAAGGEEPGRSAGGADTSRGDTRRASPRRGSSRRR